MRGRTSGRVRWVALGAIIGALAAGGIASAAVPDSGGVFHACYKTSGAVRLVNSAGRCTRSETATDAASMQFTLTLDGSHVPDATLSSGLRHEGPFTASAPFCPAGFAADVKVLADETSLTVLRRFTCDDGTGSFTAFLPNVRAEHGARVGRWQIVDGSGKYASLRGVGTYASVRLSGDPEDFLSITFRSTWSGTVDFDTVAPSIGVTARATKLRRPARTYTLQVALNVPNEAPEARLPYRLDVMAGGYLLASKVGASTNGRAATTLRIRPGRSTRRVRLNVEVTDPVGNKSSTTRTITLPR
jgi:hypothetical protein